MKKSKSKKEEKVLFKDNILVKTKYELSLVENRLYNVILYKFQKEGDLLTCTFSYDELKTVIRHKEANTIKGINDTLLRLQGKKIYVEELKENGKYSKHHNYNLIAGFSYDEEFKTFEIKAVYQVYELLRKKFQDGGYTPINMNVFLTLNNYYAQRLYDLLRLWSNTKSVINYGVEELKDYLMLKESYPAYADFKKRVIMPGIKELNKSKFFQIDIKENKMGRKVVSIDFIVKDLDKRKYFNATEIIEINNIIDNSVDNNNVFFEDKCIDVHDIKDAIEVNEKEVTEFENKNASLIGKKIANKKSLSKTDNTKDTVILPQEKNLSQEIIKLFNKDFIGINFNDNDFYECVFMDSLQDFEDDNNTKEININNYGEFKSILKENLTYEFNKQVSLPVNCILGVKYKYEFLKYCYENNINFKEVKKYALALKEAEDVTKNKKEVGKIKNKITYAYFMGTFNNKLKEYKNENTLSNNNIKASNNKLQFTNYSGQRHYNYDELENELLAIYQNR